MPDNLFTHFLLTRFNVKNPEWKADKNNDIILTDEWIDQRFSLFLDLTFPSLKGQVCQDFIWLVFFDEETPTSYLKIIENLRLSLPAFRPVFVNDWQDYNNKLIYHINQNLKPGSKYLLTSRIDNDDAFHENTMQKIQDQFVQEDQFTIDLTSGYCVQVDGNFEIREKYRENGHFISLIEKINPEKPFQTVLSRYHDEWKNEKGIKLSDQFYWIETIHSKNLVNTLSGKPVITKKALSGFNVALKKNFSIGYVTFGLFWKFKQPIVYLKKIVKRKIINKI